MRADLGAVELTIHPRPLADAKLGSLVASGAWLLASLGFLLRFHGAALVTVGVLDAFIVFTVVGLLLYARPRTALKVRNGELIRSGLHRERVVLTHGEPGRVVEFEVLTGGAIARHLSRVWLIVRGDGTVAVKLNRAAWRNEDLDALRVVLGLPVEVKGAQPVTVAREAYPGLVAWWVVHPWLFSFLLLGGLILLYTIVDLLVR
jgi:hypothetical protein